MPSAKREELRVVPADAWNILATNPRGRTRPGETHLVSADDDPFLSVITQSGSLQKIDVKTR